jgi:N6-adenosine-specific RNA methylase IME4
LIAGGRRLEACKRLKMTDVPVTVLNLEEIAKGEFHENMVRKNFTLSETDEIVEYTVKWMEKHPDLAIKSKTDNAKRVRENAAKFMGISHGQLWKMHQINAAVKANPEKHGHILDDIEGGQSINYAHKSLHNVERQDTPTPDLPTEEYELIEMDPPWKYDLDLVASPPYKTMDLDEMMSEIPKLPAYKDCILFMWATNPKLDEALKLIDFYGFTYKTNIAWVKEKQGKIQTNVGYYVKGAHELLLIATKGSPGTPPEPLRVPSVVKMPRTKHSVKPDIFYDIMETYYPAKKKISMFSRRKRDGWTTWGDDTAVTEN